MTDQEFIGICNKSISMRGACSKIGMKFSTFIRKAKKLNCYNPNQNWNKGKNVLTDERVKSKYVDSLFCINSLARREYIKRLIVSTNLLDYKCFECGLEKIWNNKIISLHLDHINGIRNDNRIENLRFLCPNCHSQTETYCSKEKSLTINSFSKEKIVECIIESFTVTDVINKLGLKDTNSNRTIIKKIVEDENIKFAPVIESAF